MGITKTNLYKSQQVELANLIKAMAHPARIAILQHLLKTNQCVCGDLVTEIGLAQATVSQHLKELKLAGLIIGEIEGTSICYCINPVTWNKLRTDLVDLFGSLPPIDIKCC